MTAGAGVENNAGSVGENPEALASMWSAEIVRAQTAPLRIEPCIGQSSKYLSKVVAPMHTEESNDVLEEPQRRS